MAPNCIIGNTGFVGYNIIHNSNIHISEFYNSKNIQNMNNEYNIILFCGLSGNVGYTNANHDKDRENVNFFINKLKTIKCNTFILISTVNVYPILNSRHTEDKILDINESIDSYGKHRLEFEKFIMETYTNHHILRLPSIYGERLKKGVLFDLLHQNYLEGICVDDKIQFYDLSNLNDDIEYIRNNDIKILNLVSEPICVRDIINTVFLDYKIIDSQLQHNDGVIHTKKRPCNHLDICSKYFENGYMYNSTISMTKIKQFIEKSKKLLVVIPLYKIKQHLSETNVNNNLFNCYQNMFKISSESYLKYNTNIEIRVLTHYGVMNNFGDMFKDITKKILDIHTHEKRDILYVESDTLCFGKINLENINKLLLFNLGTGSCDLYPYTEMMNSGVIYLPKKCNLDCEFALNLLKDYDFYVWINFERFWNILYHKQFATFEESIQYNKHMGKYNFFKTHYMPNEFITNLRSKDFFVQSNPIIVHINGSRGSDNCLNIMTDLKDLELPEASDRIYERLPIL